MGRPTPLAATGLVIKMNELLINTNPDLRKEWDFPKNAHVDFEKVRAHSSQKVWWRCPAGHEWQAKINTRALQGYGCSYCSGRYTSYEQSIAALYPKIAAEWHPTKNKDLHPDKIRPQSNKKVWWRCKSGHEWQSIVQHRTIGGAKCKACRIAERSLIYTHPELAAEWHPKKNLPLTASDVSHGMGKTVWWQCSQGHQWQAKIYSRVNARSGCRQCAVESGRNKRRYAPIAESMPELAKQWHPTKNSSLTPDQVLPGSSQKIWWICPRNKAHIWQAGVNSRAKGRGCPHCLKGPSLAEKFPDIAKEWHPTKNGELKPSDVTPGSAQRVWWQCTADPTYEWQSTVTNRTKKKGKKKCPHCTGHAVTNKTSLAANYPNIAKEWHPTKNPELTPATVTRASGRKVWWKCNANPDHEWQAQIKNRTILRSGCPQCDDENKTKRLYEALYESTQANADFLKTFTREIATIRRLSKQKFPGYQQLKQPLLRMSYASAITAMETYLCDAFFHKVINSDELIEKLLKSVPDFKERKYALTELLDWKNQFNKKVSEYLLDIVWHNLAKVQPLYETVLGVKFPQNTEQIHKGIAVRHDLVHRNGRTKTGKFHVIKLSEIETLLLGIESFVAHIDVQVKSAKKL